MRRVYRAKRWSKLFVVVFLAFSLLFLIGAWRGIAVGTNTWFDLAISLMLVLGGAVFAAHTFTIEVALTNESIRVGSIFRSQSMRLDQICYRREYEEYQDGPEGGSYAQYLEFISDDDRFPSLRILKNEFDLDSCFWEWVLRIPDIE